MSINCYSQRMLNPFRGTINVIEYQSAEAVTIDGLNWDIYVTDDQLLEDISAGTQIQTSEIRYGHWDLDNGLVRGPIYPSDDFKRLEEMGAVVYEYLLDHHTQVPFPLKDVYELWLLDQDNKPIALLDSKVRKSDITLDCPLTWRAGLACQREFHSEAINTSGNMGEYLTNWVNSRGKHPIAAQWFHRAKSLGHGIRGQGISEADEHRQLDAAAFPSFFLANDAHCKQHNQLISDFIHWQAPWILTLQNLDDNTRSNFEQLARKHAILVEKLFRLYPRIIDQSFLRAARVEARIRGEQTTPPSAEEHFATYYLELNDPHTN